MRVVFFGSAPFSVPSLKAIHESRHEIAAVVSAPDRPRGRGRKLRPTEVKALALDLGLPVLTPDDLRDASFLQELANSEADLFVVVAFRILPREVFTMPPRGTVNLHASLLPKYRGAAPIQWAILNGETRTGVTTFFIEEKVDTGDILLQREVEIGPTETAGELANRLAAVGAELLLETIDAIEENRVQPRPQVGQATRAPRVNREMGRIDWNDSAVRIARLIRALSPDPAAFTYWRDRLLNLHRAIEVGLEESSNFRTAVPGTVVKANARTGELLVRAGDGVVRVLELQPEGKRIMTAAEFLRGYHVQEGEILRSDRQRREEVD